MKTVESFFYNKAHLNTVHNSIKDFRCQKCGNVSVQTNRLNDIPNQFTETSRVIDAMQGVFVVLFEL